MKIYFAPGLLLLGCPLLTTGCGGGSDIAPVAAAGATTGTTTAATTGRAQFTIVWPERETTRLIPSAANSIQVVIKRRGTAIAQQLVARTESGRSVVTFENLPVDAVTIEANAYPNADGTGKAQASGTARATVQAGDATIFTLRLGSTINRLELSPSPVQLVPNAPQQLLVTAKAADSAIVLTTPQQFIWSGSGDVFSVSDTGLITVKKLGTGTVTVTDKESGKSVSAIVNGLEPIAITFNPDTVKVSVRRSVLLNATVTGDNTFGSYLGKLTWRVEESGPVAVVGGVTQGYSEYVPHYYYAPDRPGTFHVIATSTTDPTKSARVTIQVVSGSAEGIIQ